MSEIRQAAFWFGEPASSIPQGKPVIRRIEADEHGLSSFSHEADAVCRECGQTVVVGAQIEDGALHATTTGGTQWCKHPKCQDKFPAQVLEYRPVFYDVVS